MILSLDFLVFTGNSIHKYILFNLNYITLTFLLWNWQILPYFTNKQIWDFFHKWINFDIFYKGNYNIRLDTFSYGEPEFTPSFYWGWGYSILKLRSNTLWTIFCIFSFLFWSLHCPSLDLQFLIISLVSLFLLFCFNSSSLQFSVFIQCHNHGYIECLCF